MAVICAKLCQIFRNVKQLWRTYNLEPCKPIERNLCVFISIYIMLDWYYKLKFVIVNPRLHASYLDVNYNVVYIYMCMGRRPDYANK
jgi:hypothetical protein